MSLKKKANRYKMKKIFYVLMLACMLLMGCFGTACAEFTERPVGLLVLDYGNNVNQSFYKHNIYAPVHWAYHFPYYKVHDEAQLTQKLSVGLNNIKEITPEVMGQLCEQNKLDVLVVTKIYDTREVMETRLLAWDGPETLTQVICWADLYCYRNDSKRLLKKEIRENYLTDNNNHDSPQDTVKWQLSKLVNTMEGRSIIGGDD